MQEFSGKVAVITGGASGIGLALAERCVKEGMKVLIADVDTDALATAATSLREQGGEVETLRVDVSRSSDIEAMAQKALDSFGGIHLLVNNAGVFAGGSAWETSEKDWNWTTGVNLDGVFNGTRIIAPIMIKQDCECHIVNTASGAGLLPYHPSIAYQATKAAVVAISENTHYAMKLQCAKVGVSVLCPGFVSTNIMTKNESRRPQALQNDANDEQIGELQQGLIDQIAEGCAALAITPEQMADQTFEAIKKNEVYINAPSTLPLLEQRMKGIINDNNPPADPFGTALQEENA
jgi:NAD(P)-dependent dehydrogenase (short-subunit alcohol dehydrogenase family)